MKPDRAEILRYLRMGNATPDAALVQRIDAVEKKVLAAARPRHLADLVALEFPESPECLVGPLKLRSAALRRTLAGAKRAYLFAATLGHEVDQRVCRWQMVDNPFGYAVLRTLVWQPIRSHCLISPIVRQFA